MYDLWITQLIKNYQHSCRDGVTLACNDIEDSCCSFVRRVNQTK
jgi:hypothetical protein